MGQKGEPGVGLPGPTGPAGPAGDTNGALGASLGGIAWGLASNFLTSAITLAIALPVAASSGLGGRRAQFPPPQAFGQEFTDDELFDPQDIAGEFAGETDADDLTIFQPTVPRE